MTGGHSMTPISDLSLVILEISGDPSNAIMGDMEPFLLEASFQLRPPPQSPSKFSIIYSYEALGPGPEGTFAVKNGDLEPNKSIYGSEDTRVEIKPGVLQQGVYRTLAHLILPGTEFQSFAEGPIIQVVQNS